LGSEARGEENGEKVFPSSSDTHTYGRIDLRTYGTARHYIPGFPYRRAARDNKRIYVCESYIIDQSFNFFVYVFFSSSIEFVFYIILGQVVLCLCSPSSGTGVSWELNRHSTRHTSPVSVDLASAGVWLRAIEA